jgi:two-component system LytT family sensor kinase
MIFLMAGCYYRPPCVPIELVTINGKDVTNVPAHAPGAAIVKVLMTRRVHYVVATHVLLGTGAFYCLINMAANPALTLRMSLANQMLRFVLWALLAPVIIRFVLGHDWRLENRHRVAGTHLAMGAALSLLHAAIYLPLHEFLVPPVERAPSLTAALRLLLADWLNGLFICAIIFIVTYLMEYFARYRKQEMLTLTLKNELAEAQLVALKMQLNPHFLFNTLNNISSLVTEDPLIAKRMLARLGDFLRYTLDNSGEQLVGLDREIEMTYCYLEIERLRFEDRLQITVDIDERAVHAEVPNLILQPIVENAIQHGVANRPEGGRIQVTAKLKGDRLRMEVHNDGPRMPNPRRAGLGLANTRERLAVLYGSGSLFDIADDPEGGVRVTMEFPYKNAYSRPDRG